MINLIFEWRPFWILPKMVDPAIFQIGSIKNIKEYCLVGLCTNFGNFSQICKFITSWSPTIIHMWVSVGTFKNMYLDLVAVVPLKQEQSQSRDVTFILWKSLRIHLCGSLWTNTDYVGVFFLGGGGYLCCGCYTNLCTYKTQHFF